MMLTDPRRIEPDLLGIDGLVENVGDKGIGIPRVVVVMVVAQREVSEFHLLKPPGAVVSGCFASMREFAVMVEPPHEYRKLSAAGTDCALSRCPPLEDRQWGADGIHHRRLEKRPHDDGSKRAEGRTLPRPGGTAPEARRERAASGGAAAALARSCPRVSSDGGGA